MTTRQRRYQIKQKQLGLCKYCSNKTDINPITGLNYIRCSYHREKQHEYYIRGKTRKRFKKLIEHENRNKNQL